MYLQVYNTITPTVLYTYILDFSLNRAAMKTSIWLISVFYPVF